jgi:putative tryptophan/tyrosine transport system substrate-binding protein
MSSRWEETLATARTLGLTAELLDVRSEQDVRAAFDAALRLQVGALLVGIDSFTQSNIQVNRRLGGTAPAPCLLSF